MDGLAEKQLGLDLVSQRNPEFLETMRSYARMIARRKGWACADDLRAVADDLDMQPSHPNGWGAVFNTPEFIQVGFMRSTYAPSHGRVIRKWALRENAAGLAA